jgi:zinc D-Ala-D-Ala carboxypeptidase
MQLTKNFSYEEMIFSRVAAKYGWQNEPTGPQTVALCKLVSNVLQPLRDAFNQPIVVDSGFRSKQVNNAVEGAPGSQHTKGEAADIRIQGVSFTQVLTMVRKLRLPVDQLIDEHSQWVHISHAAAGPQRGEVLVAHFDGRKTVYTKVTFTSQA